MEVALPGRQQLRTIASAIAMVLSGLIALYASSQWETWVMWQKAVSFGQQDPILGRDVSFYVFTMPFLQFVRGIAQTLIVMAALGAGALYLISGTLTSGFSALLSMTPAVRRHIGSLIALFFLLLAAVPGLGASICSCIRPASSTAPRTRTCTARLPVALALTGISLLAVVLALLHAFTRRNWPIPVAMALYLIVNIGGEAYSRCCSASS